jgi:DNA-binding HxlR family transcriptional regulator
MPEDRESCPVTAAVDVIGGRWKPLIVFYLLDGTQRFAELRRSLGGVAQQILSRNLRELEADGLVHREVFAEVPPRVEYSLTPLGRSLEPIVDLMIDWGARYLRERGAVEAVRGEAQAEGGGAGSR